MSASLILAPPSQPATKAVSRKHSRQIPGFVWAVVTLLAVFAVLELVTRYVLVPASKDFSRFATYSRKADRLLAGPGLHVAFFGNSTTQFGVDTARMQQHLQSKGVEPGGCEMFVADASKINTWYYICNRFFWSQQRNPDLYVVNFYENNLADGNPIEIGRVAQYFTRFSDWPEILKYDLPKMSDRIEFVASSFWMTLAAKDRIKQRVLKTLIPDYEDYTAEINKTEFKKAATAKANAPARTHEALKRFLKRAQDSGAKFCFVAFPTRNCSEGKPYDLNPETLRLIREAGFTFHDLRNVPGLKPEMYRDALHLIDNGRELYTQELAKQLAPLLSGDHLSSK
ncbi:MAG: hypothetical protein U0903_07690 [Planctomycetales bacterium]